MKTLTWIAGSLTPGLALTTDAKLGQVVSLGEDGRGRRWEKVSLARRVPAEVVNGKVMQAVFGSFKLPKTDTKPEKIIYFLEREPSDEGSKLPAAIIRIKTDAGYRKDGRGRFVTVAGEPNTVISGYGAEGLAGRAGGWWDSLVIMTEGDVIKVTPTRSVNGVYEFALWMEKGGEVKTVAWEEYELMQAKSKVEAVIAETKGSTESSLKLVTGSLVCTTYVGRGEFQNGIEVTKGATGAAVILGEEGRGRVRSEVPIVGFEAGQLLTDIAVVELSRDEKPAAYSWEKPTVKVIYGLTDGGDRDDNGSYLVRVRPSTSPHRSYIRVEKLRGEPIMVARGNFASGIAGNAGSADDTLYVLRPGDAVHLDKARVIENVGGELRAPSFADWELADANENPAAYIELGRAPIAHIPTNWIGKVVKVIPQGDRDSLTGELVSVQPLTVNLGWDGRDRKVVNASGAWVEVQEHATVRAVEGDELAARETAKAEQTRLVETAKAIRDGKTFRHLEPNFQTRICKVANGNSSDWNDNRFDVAIASTEEIVSWNVWAQAVMAEVEAGNEAILETVAKVDRGEILTSFGGHFRTGGATGLENYWVIRADGTHREPDSCQFERRSRTDGDKNWKMVEADELAISWEKGYTAAPHEFKIDKLPVGGVTKAQLAAVETIEKDLADSYDGSTGISGRESPMVGKGWGLKPEPKPQSIQRVATSPKVVESAKPLDSAALEAQLKALGGGGRIRLGGRR